MINRLTAVTAVAFLATACGGGSGGTSGATGGTGTGGTTGAATGGSTTGKLLQDGVSCSANSDCSSGVCGVNGSGHCCAATCASDGGTCSATACDDTGACSFPDTSVACGTDFCGAGNKLTPNACNGAGACVPQKASDCPNHLGCNAAGSDCNTACSAKADCANGYTCNAGVCVAPTTVGTCTEDDDCFSGHCGINGTGHCCVGSTTCATGDATCGATDCDAVNGSCAYPAAGTTCGSVVASCTSGIQQDPSVCDGKGTCPTPTTKACTPFICGTNACLTTCTDNTSCGAGAFCDIGHSSCCSALADGATMSVDATAGNDAIACCSVPGYGPCQTLTQVMKQIDQAQAKNVTINPVVRNGATWNPPNEVYPVVLGWGVELNAPGLFFTDPAPDGGSAIIHIDHVSQNDTVGYASIVGTAAKVVTIGGNEFSTPSLDSSSIEVASGSTLYLANANVNGNAEFEDGFDTFPNQTTAITLAGGATLVVAQDQSATITGTVTIGNAIDSEGTNGWNGIVCEVAQNKGCTIRDTPLDAGVSALVIEGQENVDIEAKDYASISLTQWPVIGFAPTDAGFGTCSDKVDAEYNSPSAAVTLTGNATMTFTNGIVECIGGDGFDLSASSKGNPTLTIDSSTIQHTEWGINAYAGKATVTNSTIIYNYNGVQQSSDGINDGVVDLSGGSGGSNTVICSDSFESFVLGGQGFGPPGASVINATATPLNASNVTWDTAAPDLFGCDPNLDNCTCLLSSCTNVEVDGGLDGLSAVEIGDAGAIDTSGNALTTVDCDFPPPPPPEMGCGPNNPCKPPFICCGIGGLPTCEIICVD